MARKAKSADPIDELEAELEGLEEIEVDEDVEEDDDEQDEDVDLSSMTAAQLKAHAKSLGIKGTDKKNKATLLAMIEAAGEEDEEEDEEEEDEEEVEEVEEDDDGLDEMTRAELKAHIKAEGLEVKVFKSDSDEDIVAKIREATEDEEEEEDEEPAPKAKAKTPPTKKGQTKRGAIGPKPLPNGRLSAGDVADMAGMKAINVRNFLRSDAGQAFPKDESLGRYSFTQKQALAIVKEMGNRPNRAKAGTNKGSTAKATTKTTTKKGTTKRRAK